MADGLRPVKVSQFVRHSEVPTTYCLVDKPRDCQFVIGSRNPLPVEKFRQLGPAPVRLDEEIEEDYGLTGPKLNIVPDTANRTDVYLKGRKQHLNSYDWMTPFRPWVIWMGDLDGDQQKDYIIEFGQKSSQVVLFLSSQARKGEFVRPVAVFLRGYCC